MENIFEPKGYNNLAARINSLSNTTEAQWGKMNVAQMLAHCNVAFDMTYHPENFPKVGAFKRFILKTLIKPAVVGPKPYAKNSRTAPVFIIKGDRDFEQEKTKILAYLKKTHELGADGFEQREYINFGKMTSQEWNTLFAKHLEHHLRQFGV